MRRRSSFSRSRSSNRRKLVWSYSTGAVSLATADNEVFDLLAPLRTAGSSVLGATVMRTHLRLANQAASITRGDSLAWGLIAGESQDVGLNIAGAPNPNAEPHLDWAMITRHFATISGGALAGAGQASYFDQNNNSMLFDIKAKRKIQEMNQSWHLVLNQAAGPGTAGNAQWQFQARVLLALP